MDRAGYLTHLRRDLAAFEACLGADVSAPVAHCGDWTLYDLADHLGGQNLWVAAAVTEHRGDFEAPPAPRDPAALAAWLSETGAVLLAALDTDPGTPAWTIAPPATVGFWQRRRCMETLIHRWDAEHAAGTGGFIDPALADDGVAEVVDTMLPRQIRLGRTGPLPHAVRLDATDTGSSWLLGGPADGPGRPGDPVAAIQATAAGLLLLLWGRLDADDPAIAWSGDREQGRAALSGSLVP
jgi:uncharacterized protein (TIGR03083 family)